MSDKYLFLGGPLHGQRRFTELEPVVKFAIASFSGAPPRYFQTLEGEPGDEYHRARVNTRGGSPVAVVYTHGSKWTLRHVVESLIETFPSSSTN